MIDSLSSDLRMPTHVHTHLHIHTCTHMNTDIDARQLQEADLRGLLADTLEGQHVVRLLLKAVFIQ